MTILVTGGFGALGAALREFLPNATYLSHADCDVTQPASIQASFASLCPATVIHAAALTDHNAEPCEAMRVNALGTANVARWARAFGARLVYLSTHYVYPGEVGGYDEQAELRPVGAYAWTKLLGERYVEDTPDALIVRGSWYTPAKLALWRRVGAFNDAWGSRESVRDAARKVAALVRDGASGVFNIGGPRRTFHEIALSESRDYYRVPARSRERCDATYPFPRDASVSTAKYEAWERQQHPYRSVSTEHFVLDRTMSPGDYINNDARHAEFDRTATPKTPRDDWERRHWDQRGITWYRDSLRGFIDAAIPLPEAQPQGDGDPFFPVV